MSKAKILREKARATLGNKPFKSGWLWPLLICIIAGSIASITSFASLVIMAILNVALASYFVALTRRTAEANDIKAYFSTMKDGIKGKICLSLVYNLYMLLWGIVPIANLVKPYSYAMTFYIKADHPEYTSNQAITASREMMNGYKWKLFCLELSFLGWDLLSIITFGVLAYWVAPYKNAAKAQFYEELKAINAGAIAAE